MHVAVMQEADIEIVGMQVSRGANSDREQNLKKGQGELLTSGGR
jgi:hypothetical protein